MKSSNCVLSASTIEGDTVKNAEGEEIGSIKDIMICTSTNEVRYYVLSFGGVFGLGDKLFAIPPEAMTCDTDNECFVLNIEKEALEAQEGFDKDNWPDFADASFRDKIYGHYGYTYQKRKAA